MWLNAACNLAIKDGLLKFNPFAGILPKCDDTEKRLPLRDSDIRECKRNLGKLGEADQLLFPGLLATTGMRLGEAFQIDGEEPKEKGCRFVIIGKKSTAILSSRSTAGRCAAALARQRSRVPCSRASFCCVETP